MANRNTLYVVVGALAIALGVVGYLLYQERQRSGIAVELNESGLSVETR